MSTRLTVSEGRRFGLTVGLAFVVLAALLLWRSREGPAYVAAGIGILLLAGGLVAPARMGPVKAAWMAFAHAISRVTTPVFMGVVYFLVLTPTGWVMRAMGRNPLGTRRGREGYWVERERPGSDLERQF